MCTQLPNYYTMSPCFLRKYVLSLGYIKEVKPLVGGKMNIPFTMSKTKVGALQRLVASVESDS